MSLYNQLFGVNPLAGIFLKVLGLTPDEVGRFRDCYAEKGEDGEPRIFVFTRNGGGNRDDYAAVFDRLSARPDYVRDFDDSFDRTYATIEFRVAPEKREAVLALLEALQAEAPDAAKPPMQKFQSLMNKLQGGARTDDPEVAHALDVGKRILAPLVEAMKKGEPAVVLIPDRETVE